MRISIEHTSTAEFRQVEKKHLRLQSLQLLAELEQTCLPV